MDKNLMLKGLIAGAVVSFASAFSAAGMVDVTTWDGEGVLNEDGETEPGTVNSQVWDLEGVFLDDASLSMVGGFDFFNGVAGYSNYTSGDLFISSGTPLYGLNAPSPDGTNLYGYNYVFDIDWDNRTDDTVSYTLLEIDADTQVINSYANQNNPGSNPWLYGSGAVQAIDSGTLTMSQAPDMGFSGEEHFMLGGFDLQAIYDAIGTDHTFYSHFTMGCGNDNLMGQWTVPEPATFALFGVGIAGLWLSRRRQTASAQTA